jgi:hypothetical protein
MKLPTQQYEVEAQIVIDVECLVVCNDNHVDRHFHDAVEAWRADVDVDSLGHWLGGEIEDVGDVVGEVTSFRLHHTEVTSVEPTETEEVA